MRTRFWSYVRPSPRKLAIILGLALAALVPLAAVAQITNWPEFQFGNDRLGFNPYEVVLKPSNVNNLGVLWQVNQGQQLITVSPAVVNGIVYGVSFGEGRGVTNLFALNAQTGATVWSRPLLGQFFLSAPTVSNGVLYVGLGLYLPYYTGAMYAFDARSGALLWSNSAVNAIQTAPTVGNGAVYFGSDDGNIYALDASSGHQLWHYNTNTGQGAGSAGALVNGVFYIGLSSFVYALNASDGTLLWQYQLSSFIAASPAVQDGVVYISSYDGHVYALNASTGTLIWRQTLNDLFFTSPSAAYGKIYVCGGENGLTALDAQTGNVVWSYPTAQCQYATPSVANGVVYVGWQPSGTQNGHISAFDAMNGNLLWDYQPGSAVTASSVVVNGVLFTPTYNGDVFAFSLNGH